MPINLQIRKDLSLNELVSLERAGFPVFKTPHVGCWYPNNLACAMLGIPMKVVDATKGCLDRNFHPHCLIVGGQRIQIADENVLTSHALITHPPSVMTERFTLGRPTADVHMEALHEAIPAAQTQTVSAYFHEHVGRLIALFEVITRTDPHVWERFVNEEGMTENRRPFRGWQEISRDGVVGTNGSRAGWISPNVANILTDVTIDPVLFGTDTVYELSGPDMYRYIERLMPKLNELYDAVRRSLNWSLPEVVTLNLVPVSDMRFAVLSSRRRALDELVDVWLATTSFEAGVGERIRHAVDKRSMISYVQEQRRVHTQALMAAVQACPDPFYDISEGTYVSQYDLLTTSQDLYLHPWALETPTGQLTDAVNVMRRYLAQ